MWGSSMIPILISPGERGLFILVTSGIMTRWSRSTIAGSTFLVDGVGLPAAGCGCRGLSPGPADCTAQPAARIMTTKALRIRIFISCASPVRSHQLANAIAQHGERDLLTVEFATEERLGEL